jgi:hypothetical protein
MNTGVFDSRRLRKIFGPKGEEVTGNWRRLQNGELRNLYSSPNIIPVIKARRMRWAGHVARRGRGTCIEFYWENLREIDHWEDLEVDWTIILKPFKKWECGHGLG